MRRIYVGFILLSLVFALGFARATQAAAPDLFFSEYIEGSSNNKALEIYNGTGAAVDLAAAGYQIEMYFNGNSNAGLTLNLTGSVADGDVYVVAHSSAVAEILAEADYTSGAGFFNGDDAVVLRKGTVVVDAIGQVGFDPGSQWGSGDVSTADNTLRRLPSICAGDTIPDDVFDPALAWDGYPQNTFDGLGSHTADCNGGGGDTPPAVAISEIRIDQTSTDNDEYFELTGAPGTALDGLTYLVIGDGTGGSGVIESVTDLSGQVIPDDGIFLAAESTMTLGVPDMVTNLNFENSDNVTHLLVWNFSGANGQDLDTNDDGVLDVTPWAAQVDLVALILQENPPTSTEYHYGPPAVGPDGSFVPGHVYLCEDGWFIGAFDPVGGDDTPGGPNACPTLGACGEPATFIHAVQGAGLESPLAGAQVAIEGIVVGDFQDDDGDFFDTDLDGFYVQEEAGDDDGDALTSEGVFVYAPGAEDVQPGDVVRVFGRVSEYDGLTEISMADMALCGSGPVPAPLVITLPESSPDELERYEGMLVTIPGPLVISEYFNFDRYGEIVLTPERLFQPTALADPYTDLAEQIAAFNALQRITLDDGRTVQNPDPAYHPNGSEFTLDNLFRGGDWVTDVTGVLDDRFDLYRIQPTTGAGYIPENLRPEVPEAVGGSLKVASFNVLNYFTTLGSRGADTPEEFARQQAKIVAALAVIDADVVGVIEIENNDVALGNLVAALNDVMGAGTYDYIATGAIGTDEIKQGLLYKPATVAVVGDVAVLDDPGFVNPFGAEFDRNRPAVVASFMDTTTGGVFTVAVNHLKSKGSECGPGDDDPVQGNCNATRAAAAAYLVDWLATDPTGVGDADYLIIGDLNAYDYEDPIDVITAGPDDVLGTGDDYVDLLRLFEGEFAYTYVFDGQLGYLDYGMASLTLLDEVTGATAWHINADEPDLIDYDMSFKQDAQDALFAPNPFRASDHDPVIVGLAVCDEVPPEATVSVTPEVLWPANHKYVEVAATVVAADNFDPDPTVTLVSVVSNEPDDGEDDGATVDDIVIVDDVTFMLRAERSGVGTGRVYTITYQVTDACGNSTLATATVTVPLSMGR